MRRNGHGKTLPRNRQVLRWVPEVDAATAFARSALAGIVRVVGETVSDMEAHGEAPPDPMSAKPYSGKFQVRIPPERPQGARHAGSRTRHQPQPSCHGQALRLSRSGERLARTKPSRRPARSLQGRTLRAMASCHATKSIAHKVRLYEEVSAWWR